MALALIIETMIILIIGALSIIEGVRVTLHRGVQLYDIVGPGLYNVGIGAFLLVLGLGYFLSRRFPRPSPKKAGGERGYRLNMMKMICILAGYIALIDLIGYFFSTLLFFFLITRVVGFTSWFTNISVSLGMTFSFYLIFARFLNMIFPPGAWTGF